jgi:hypothetical protein
MPDLVPVPDPLVPIPLYLSSEFRKPGVLWLVSPVKANDP